jgi:hypothetical protein
LSWKARQWMVARRVGSSPMAWATSINKVRRGSRVRRLWLRAEYSASRVEREISDYNWDLQTSGTSLSVIIKPVRDLALVGLVSGSLRNKPQKSASA